MKLSEKIQRVHTFGDYPKDELIFDAIQLESIIDFFESCKNQYIEKGELKK